MVKVAIANQLSKHEKFRKFINHNVPILYEQCTSKDDQRSVYEALINVGNIDGLKRCVEWTRLYNFSPFTQSNIAPAFYEDIAALPYFMTLIELSYDPQILTQHPLDRMLPLVMRGLESLALAHKENYPIVASKIKEFIAQHSDLPDVRFLNSYLEDMKTNFGIRCANTYTLLTAKRFVTFLIS